MGEAAPVHRKRRRNTGSEAAPTRLGAVDSLAVPAAGGPEPPEPAHVPRKSKKLNYLALHSVVQPVPFESDV